MGLRHLTAFVKVVQTGSFTRAADLLDTQKAQLSRTVAALERELGVRLLERTTRSVRATEIGRAVFERAQGILDAGDDLVRLAQQLQAAPQGRLRLTCPEGFGHSVVTRWITCYLAQHPKVVVEADYTARLIDLVHEGFDLAIRVGRLESSSLAARRLGELHYGLFAAPAYLKRRGTPEHPDEMAAHALLMFVTASQRSNWSLHRGDERHSVPGPPALRSTSSFLLRDAAIAGLGIARLPLVVLQPDEKRRLRPLLTDWQLPPTPVHAVFPSNRLLAPTVRSFIDHAADAASLGPARSP